MNCIVLYEMHNRANTQKAAGLKGLANNERKGDAQRQMFPRRARKM